jgi:hypothetical protein
MSLLWDGDRRSYRRREPDIVGLGSVARTLLWLVIVAVIAAVLIAAVRSAIAVPGTLIIAELLARRMRVH